MAHRKFLLPFIFLAILAHVALFLGLGSASPVPNVTSAQVAPDATSVGAFGLFEDILSGRHNVPIITQWYFARTTWWVFTRTYDHEVTLTVGERQWGEMKYTAKGYGKHCSEDRQWCVTHGDPDNMEMTVWFRERNYYQKSPRFYSESPTFPCRAWRLDMCRFYHDKMVQ